MYRIVTIVLIALFVVSCGKENGNLIVNGTVEGLRKGTIYFQKMQDSTLINIDSVEISGDPHFGFSTTIESPEVFTLYLDKNDGNELNDRLDFFAEPGNITINTTRDYFAPEAKIEGSESHDKWMEYKKILSKFNDKNLEFIKETLQAEKDGDTAVIDSLQKASAQNITRRYLYTINFILNNTDSYTAPYITLTDAYNTNIKYLDSINTSLTQEVADSKYGEMLAEYVDDLKQQIQAQDSIK